MTFESWKAVAAAEEGDKKEGLKVITAITEKDEEQRRSGRRRRRRKQREDVTFKDAVKRIQCGKRVGTGFMVKKEEKFVSILLLLLLL